MIKMIMLVMVIGLMAGCDSEQELLLQNKKENAEIKADEIANEKSIKVEYNPESCKTDAKQMVYFALGETVFKTHYQEPIFIRDLPPERKAEQPRRPDPSEPEGCPDNPIMGGGFTFAYRYKALKVDAGDSGRSMFAEQLSITQNSHWLLQDSAKKTFTQRKGQGTCAEIDNGLIACRLRGNEEKPEDWAASYKAKQDVYDAPFNRPFIVECNYGVVGRICRVLYKLHATVLVSYKFRPKNIPIPEIINFDRALRKKIENMRVPDYQWRDDENKTK